MNALTLIWRKYVVCGITTATYGLLDNNSYFPKIFLGFHVFDFADMPVWRIVRS
jgi:hypothetical protein